MVRQETKDSSRLRLESAYSRKVDALGTVVHYIRLLGWCPSKKNRYRIAARGRGKVGLKINDDDKAFLDALQFQANSLWQHQPLSHPEMVFRLTTSNPAQDSDGALTATLDILQVAGVLINDNIRHFNGAKVILPADICEPGKEFVEICLREKR
jgi:hypothetical protein